MKANLIFTLLIACLLIIASGCQQPSTYTLSGEVRVEGQAPDDGSIAIESESGGPGLGAHLDHGKFRVEKVPAGKARVKFVVRKKMGTRKPAPDAPPFDFSVDILPARYQDGLPIEVTGDQLDLDFNLAEKQSSP